MSRSAKILLLDANVFMEAHKRYYAFDICPGFWACIVHCQTQGKLMSIDKVKQEIETGNDKLWEWVEKNAPADLFQSTNEQKMQDAYSKVMQWVSQQPFTNEAKTGFAGGADGWLVAHAEVNGMKIVTDEILNLAIKRRVPIPNVCVQFDVPYQNTFAMLRELEVKFQWSSVGAYDAESPY